MKISLDANQSIILGSEGGKETDPNSSADTDIIAFLALSGWQSTPDILFLNTSPLQMLFLLKKIVHTEKQRRHKIKRTKCDTYKVI